PRHLSDNATTAAPAIFVHRGAGRDRIGPAALGLHLLDRLLPALADADIETFVHHLQIGAHDAAEQDVADAVIDGVLVRHPAFLHETALHPDLGGDGRDHAGVIGLHAADRHQRIGVGGDRVGDDVFELAQLVAAEREPRITVFTLGVKFDL